MAERAPIFEWNDWTFDPAEWRLTGAGRGVLSLHNKSLELLAVLLERAPALVPKDEILALVWPDAAVEEGNIAFHVAMLRKALDGAGGEPSCIETVRSRGYRFVAPVTRRDPPPVAEVTPPVSQDPPPRLPAARPRHTRRRAVPLVLGAVVLGGIGVAGWLARGEPRAGGATPAATSRTVAEAASLVLQARENWSLRTPPAVQQAIAQYERAIAIDPSYAPAYAGLADCYNLTMSGLPSAVRYERAKANIERALALDPNLPEAITARGFLRYKFEWQWNAAEADFKRAIAAAPDYVLAHHWYGEFLGLMGRYEEATVQLRQALALEPGSLAIQGDLVPPLLRAGRVSEARAVVERAGAANPNWYWIPRRRSEVLAAEGRERESLEELWRAQVLSGATLESIDDLRAAYRAGGMDAVLRLEIQRLEAAEKASPGGAQNATSLSLHYARLGDTTSAMRWLRVAVDRREDAAIHLLTNPAYDRLRALPEFNQQLASLGLTPLRN